MNIPVIAKNTFDSLRNRPEFLNITQFIIKHLEKIAGPSERARFVHNVIDQYNEEVFSHPLVIEYMPCKAGCSACCHTQVSVTSDEARLLMERIENGVIIDQRRLDLQNAAGNDAELFFKLSYEDRKCVFLSSKGECSVYSDRPSVCRTNAVLGAPEQCDTRLEQKSLRLVKTSKSDMAIVGAFAQSVENGSLPVMIKKLMDFRPKKSIWDRVQKLKSFKKLVSKDFSL